MAPDRRFLKSIGHGAILMEFWIDRYMYQRQSPGQRTSPGQASFGARKEQSDSFLSV